MRSLLVVVLLTGLAGIALAVESMPAAAPRVEIYTSASCGYCKVLRRYLKVRGIEFTEHNINATLETRATFFAMGGRGVPLTVIEGQPIEGFDPLRIEAALKAARQSGAGS